MFLHFLALVGVYVTGFVVYILPCIALGLVCAIPFIIRRIIDYV